MIRVSYPGKLFLTGEYAALELGQRSVIKSVNRFLHVELENQDFWHITSSYGEVVHESVFDMASMPEVSAALWVVREYLDHELKPAAIRIISDLDDGDRKYGFGSSGVVIVAVIAALLKRDSREVDPLTLFKLSVLAQVKQGKYSSGGDLASSIYGGTILYSRYDLSWLNKQTMSVKALVGLDWPALTIDPLDLDSMGEVLIGWTQKPNKTEHYTSAVKSMGDKDPMTYRAFLVSSNHFVDAFVDAVHTQCDAGLSEAIKHYRTLMSTLGKWANIDIETDALRCLIDTSISLGFPAKVSGSGGGDCGYAFRFKSHEASKEALIEAWKKNNIVFIEG